MIKYNIFFIKLDTDENGNDIGINISTHKNFRYDDFDFFISKKTNTLLIEYISPKGKQEYTKTYFDKNIEDITVFTITVK